MLPALIPRTILFGNPTMTNAQISPDGRLLAYLAPDTRDVLQVWVRGIDEPADRSHRITDDPRRGVMSYFWSEDGTALLYEQDADGDENFHLYAVDPRKPAGAARDLTPFPGVKVEGIWTDARFPDEILVGMNHRDAGLFDVHRIRISTGESTLELENPGDLVGWTVDPDLRVRAVTAAAPDGGWEVRVRDDVGAPWRRLLHWGADDSIGSSVLAFTPDGMGLMVGSSADSDTVRLVRIDIATGAQTVIAAADGSDLRDTIVHPITREVQAAAFGADRLRWTACDPGIAPDLERAAAVHRGDMSLASRDHADRFWIILFTNDSGPVPWYLYDRTTGEAALLFHNRPELTGYDLAPMKPFTLLARDGMEIHCLLTLPLGIEPKGLPAVLNIHGGPWHRDTWGYDPEAQWLANRGYACLQVNYRGSTGFGKSYINAGDREWGGRMQDDISDAARWLIDQGIADPARIGIYGGSYGGYAVLAGVTFTPDLYACGVDIVGPSNLLTWLDSIPPYWETYRELLARRIGDPVRDRESLEARSPFFHIDRIRAPLLIAQGANDPRVPKPESDQIVERLRAGGRVVDYILFEDEGHGFARPENRLRFMAAAEQFLARHLGGRSEDPS